MSSANPYTNTTIDDTDPSITYQGIWDPPVDVAYTPLDYGGSHHLSENNGTATFSFTGVAVYFWSPLWPYLVNTMVTLDGQNSNCLNLQDFSGAKSANGEETQQSTPRWGMSGLANTQHQLFVSPCHGGPFVILDAITYTQYTPPPATTTTIPTPATPTASGPISHSLSHKTVIIISSSVAGGVGVLLIMLALLGFFLRRNRRRKRDARVLIDGPQMANHYPASDPFNPPSTISNYSPPVSYHQGLLTPSPYSSARPNLPEL